MGSGVAWEWREVAVCISGNYCLRETQESSPCIVGLPYQWVSHSWIQPTTENIRGKEIPEKVLESKTGVKPALNAVRCRAV